MSSSPEMDNTGRGRGRGEIHREPRFVPGQERPQGDNDGLPTYEQQEGYLLSYEEVMTGRLAPRQASETPEQEQTGWISKIMPQDVFILRLYYVYTYFDVVIHQDPY
ncbi:hypothetical protein TKK_0005174 [Trichogramma kaykai]